MEKKSDEYYTRPPQGTRLQEFKSFIWNPSTHAFFGRTAKSWIQILVFYVILYLFLAGFFAAMLIVFFQTLDSTQPRWLLADSRLGNNPGMGFRPANEDPDLLPLSFDQNDASSYQGYVSANKKSIDKFLVTYDPDPGVEYATCNYDIETSGGKICRFVMTRIPDTCNEENAYGFKSGEPCVFLKLNKLFGWTPEPYMASEVEANEMGMPEELQQRILALKDEKEKNSNVWVSCIGEGKADIELMEKSNTTMYYGNHFGFPNYFYPFENQKGYQAPFVVLQMKNLPKGKAVRLICRAWAKNISLDRQRRLGMTLLEILSK